MATIIRAGDCATQEQILFTAAAVGLTTDNYNPTTGIAKGQIARAALINLESDDIRFHVREAALTPAANCGMIFVKGDYLYLDSPQQIACFRGVNTGGGSATAVVFYFF